ncbi:ActS/PrrB/RegB family redox-sensitive histidine kinase [Primorskyibacter aestuariivivens]|uniref:sensor histidine kinase RegB n=1 Tax=Primorskyibacter aestuariivivens TaxID=1888912 RepID=UPI0023005E71|nr:ActS/PrrB/RegB family redox-sensitive histidine kinase [Primorskyibacter aestuariivivens]MDA7427642.1 ActS/PrrB/RegB family redox-sensitive histidine kinase [Primorskyibacter aestuariivivens]
MTDPTPAFLTEHRRGNWVRLRTLIMLRWIAIVGQLVALIVAQRMYNLTLEIGLCYLAIGISVVGNLIAIAVFPENKRLSESENIMMVLFDLLQLSFLLYLTGGLHNPFSLLILGPVLISAAVLTTGPTIFIGIIAILLVSLLAVYHLPLRTEYGFILRIPNIFIFGKWLALVIAIVFLSAYSRRVTNEMHTMSDAVAATQMALAREQKLTDLTGVVAAAAHELGTPLATIKLTSSELAEELIDQPELYEDAQLIRDQADRCRDILRSMGRAGKADMQVRTTPLSELIREAAEPHENRGKDIHFDYTPGPGGDYGVPTIQRQPEIIHGLRNLIQNAVDFARANVWIEAMWTDDLISIRIVDDGSGYPPQLIGRIGDPFVRKRRSERDLKKRPGYEGMGLGLFIAKTLLERSGAELSFANGSDPYQPREMQHEKCGAVVEVVWPLSKVASRTGRDSVPLGDNQPIEI